MICIDFSTWNWNLIASISSFVGAMASVISVCLVVGIFRQWKEQKRIEAVALEASSVVEKVVVLRENVMAARAEKMTAIENVKFIEDVRLRYEQIERALKLINLVEKDLEYKTYITSITKLIEKWQRNKEEQDEYLDFCEKTNDLCDSLTLLKLFMNINQPLKNTKAKYRRIF